MGAPNAEKGKKYIGLLDQALCNGNWLDIQELARKVDKHAPDRKCLTATARAEAQIASATHRPDSASSGATSSIHGLGDIVNNLKEASSAERKYPEDAYAANVCVAEICWLREDSEAALEAVPQSDDTHGNHNTDHTVALGWLEVCEIKARLIKSATQEVLGRHDGAIRSYMSAVRRAPVTRTPELRKWTERLLARACIFMYTRTTIHSIDTLNQALRCFMSWSDFWQRSMPTPPGTVNASYLDISGRRVWKAYYDLLSTILRYGLIVNDSTSIFNDLLLLSSHELSDEQQIRTLKSRQRATLRGVEATYESILLNETQFPKASQTNTEVEEWVQQAVNNWKLLCGPGWSASELGDGGREGVGRVILDILYRAATKTFHSTAILRHLFTLHAALGDFDLAMNAFDSYVEIVGKGKARAQKTGKHEIGFDSDDDAICTAAEAVRLLCKYGDREQAEKAIEVGKTIEKWLGQDRPVSTKDAKMNGDDNRTEEARPEHQHTRALLKPDSLAAAYRAIGVSQAHWARLTYESESRAGLQGEALQKLEKAQTYDEESIDTAYSLGLLLADMRDVPAAMQVMKRVLASPGPEAEEDGSMDFLREKRLIPLWHLFALCLTAKDDYEQGVKMCEAAFEQFGDSTVLFGEKDVRISSDSEKAIQTPPSGIVDQMDAFGKEAILQLKITQLTFLELTEGPEAAVDVSQELLALYARLFGNTEVAQKIMRPPPTAVSAAPSKFGGTLRSIAGSIRPRTARPPSEKQSYLSVTDRGASAHGTDANGSAVGVPISITVTNEEGVSAEKSHQRHPFKLRGVSGDWRQHGNLRTSKSQGDMRRAPSPILEEKPPSRTHSKANGAVRQPSATVATSTSTIQQGISQDSSPSPQQPLGEVAHIAPHDEWPPPTGHQDQQHVRHPTQHPSWVAIPSTSFASVQDRQHKISLLVEVWLSIAALYLRADLLDDAGNAVDEASKLIESFEVEVASEHSSARRFLLKGWGGGKSVDGLWGDVWSAKGYLASASQHRFQAIAHFEKALSHFPDHAEGIIGLSNLLMDIYEEKIPAEEPRPLLKNHSPIPPAPQATTTQPTAPEESASDADATDNKRRSRRDPTPAELNRLASRDRAYMLLSTLTRLGTGWDNSEAWYTLARAHELSKQVDKAKSALWWVVELEDNKPIRPWLDIAPGGFAL